MAPSRLSSAFGRVFSCWPSRIGAASLLALTVSWGAETLKPHPDLDALSHPFEAAAR